MTKTKKLKQEFEKELENLIKSLKIFISRENHFLFKGRIGKLIDKGKLQERQDTLKDVLDLIDNAKEIGSESHSFTGTCYKEELKNKIEELK